MLAASLFFLRIEANREDRVFNDLKTAIDAATGRYSPADSVVTGAMHLTHALLTGRARATGGDTLFTGWPLRSCTMELINPRGSASYAKVLARLLQCYHYPVRIGEMKANGRFGAHRIVEVQIDGRWIIADATYDLVYTHYADIRYCYRSTLSLQVYTLLFNVVLVIFVLLNMYIYLGMRGRLPWQKTVAKESSGLYAKPAVLLTAG